MKKKWTAAARQAFAEKMAAARGLKKGKRRKTRAKNPAVKYTPGVFQIVADVGGKVMYWDGAGVSAKRQNAASFASQKAAQSTALNMRTRHAIAVVNSTVSPQKIRDFFRSKK